MFQTPSGGAGQGAAATDSGLMSIGAVLNALRDEFPDITISKIRFLESEGLVEPRRTPAGYRKFGAHDVERLGQVLRMQRDHYLPLKVIREHLDAVERSGIGEQELKEWESYGLLVPLPDGAYDAEAVTVASLVVQLGRFGIEPRHLRVMKAAADREAGLVDQVVAPLKRHRNPQTRAHAEARTKELAGLAVKLHAALVQTALGVRLP